MSKFFTKEKIEYKPNSPINNMIRGVLFGLLSYLLGWYDIRKAIEISLAFGLLLNTADYATIYYKNKRR